MKKGLFNPLTTICFLTLSSAPALYAQTMDIFGGLGYGFGIGGYTISSTTIQSAVPGNRERDREDKYLNYGQGFKMELGTGYYVMEKVQAQFSLEFNSGIPSIEETDRNTILGSDTSTTYNRSTFGIKAGIAPRFTVLDLLDMYTGVGFGLFLGYLSYETTTGGFKENGKYESSPSIGLIGKIGADYPLSDLLTLYGEFEFQEKSFVWNKQIVENTTIPGNRVGSTTFEKDIPNSPAPEKISGSNWMIKVGARYVLF